MALIWSKFNLLLIWPSSGNLIEFFSDFGVWLPKETSIFSEWGEFSKEKMIEVFKTFIFAICIAVFLRSFAYEPFTIPSGSMKPNLLVGDFLFVSKFSYGFSKYSVPYGRYLPFNERIFYSKPVRGDIAVFKYPGDNKTDYIKRIIGLPGDTIRVTEGIIYINDIPIKKEKIGTFEDYHRNGYLEKFDLYKETNDKNIDYLVIKYFLKRKTQ